MTQPLAAAPPVVKTVPWVASNPLVPHTTYENKTITLKGTCDQQGSNIKYWWDFGDGSAIATGTVSDKYVIQASHAYTGAPDSIYTARLTVQNETTGEQASKAYYVQVKTKSLDIEVNVAIDEGLWYLHKMQGRFADGSGDWMANTGYASRGYTSVTAANLNAFEVNGHLESGNPDNPYTETVARGMKRLFTFLAVRTLPIQSGNRDPDNNNNLGIYVSQGQSYYQGGMFMDAIVASGTPNAITTTGPSDVINRSYRDIVQDMVDDHAAAQYDDYRYGGWRYEFNQFPDNSACQWAAIGLIAAERNWGCAIPQWVKEYNVNWLHYTQDGLGGFGYTDPGYYPWGPYATTPSGMVQMAMDGIGRGGLHPNNYNGIVGWPDWDKAETYLRDRFGNTGGAGDAIKSYYYGLLSFTKSMLLYPYDGDEDSSTPPPNPIKLLKSKTAGVPSLDWYGAELSKGAPTDGVARTLVNSQSSPGYWYGHDYTGEQYFFETAWAIMMLHRTIFESGAPVAVAKAFANPAVASQVITLSGSDSYSQDPTKEIVNWEWDLDSDGTYDGNGPFISTSFASIGNYPVKLRVTDNNTPPKTAETIVTILVTTPPIAPTAAGDGPYIFCPGVKWFLDGRKSVNPDEGQHEAGNYPGDTIQEYAWDLDGDHTFDVFGPTPDVTAWFAAKGPGSYLVTLRVTDTTSQSYPSSPLPDLTSTTTAEVIVKGNNDAGCMCSTLTATPAVKSIQLDWTAKAEAHHYNLYRSTIADGPYTWIQTIPAGTLTYLDSPGILNQVYYYIIRPARQNDNEICQSNEVLAEPLHPKPVVTVSPATVANVNKNYYQLGLTSQSFGRNQCPIWVKDSASALVAGPYFNAYILYIRTGMAAASVKPGPATSPVKALIGVKGKAIIWAEDPIGQKSNELIIP
jgi:hypothetical protein